ncbi:zinc finger Ran-binding domain-containing protein 2 [Galendromus occidentalis]|uniref:Zinc finger Ran-binding domain-containing protein 2 n=1 Tax=Galendromus occidentalis TaxID=34638 RepID=A0AAJ7SGA5_9ACAR|nr:zinc finger Ran-binding domain-containing protein 2 [Galendromus occidentalis]
MSRSSIPKRASGSIATLGSATMSGTSFQLPDWECPDEKCRNVNFGKRTACNRCGIARPREHFVNATKKLGHEIGKQAADKSNGLFSADDWQCGKCGNVNWARRNNCNMCGAPKVGEVERRTGLGGGYNERESVEYKERREHSDDEYDDFGRRKRRKASDTREKSDSREASSSSSSRGRRDRSRSPIPSRRDRDYKPIEKQYNDEEEDDEEDDDDDADLSKYDLLA